MIDAANYEKPATLKNGVAVKIRSVRPADKSGFIEAFKKLDPDTIYTRFFHPQKALSDEDLKTATELDFENAVALVVTIGEGAQEVIIGGGRFVVIEESSRSKAAEVAFTVEEDYQRQGIARLLLQHLALIARQKGLTHFVAEVLPENRGMLAVFARCGLPMQSVHGGDAVHVTLSLAQEDPPSSPRG
ncbi:MAG: GNAT family N-acetyltransferase [Desulfobacterales bacterium]|jgi:GNAT superfamily N-acetyltransferase|nr:GNAT family N-acetyltransferase [Desulfobacterales bacterium]